MNIGLVTRDQAVAAGATDEMIERRVRSGRWVRVGPSVYRMAGAAVTWKQRVLAACLIAGPGAVASHRCGAALFGVSGFRPGPVHITVPAGRSGRNPLATAHRTTSLGRIDRAIVDRVPVTAPARLIVDLAGSVTPTSLEGGSGRRAVPPAGYARSSKGTGRRP